MWRNSQSGGCLISQYDHISQLKLLVLFLLLALVLNKSRYVLKKICKRSHNYCQTVLEFKYVKRTTFYCQTSHH